MLNAQQMARLTSQYNDQFRRTIKILLAVSCMTQEELATMVGISRRTLDRRMKDPGGVTKAEERRICQLCRQNRVEYQSECVVNFK